MWQRLYATMFKKERRNWLHHSQHAQFAGTARHWLSELYDVSNNAKHQLHVTSFEPCMPALRLVRHCCACYAAGSCTCTSRSCIITNNITNM
jgi:hypothetical protein